MANEKISDPSSEVVADSRILDAQLEVYKPAFLEYGDSPKGTHQNNQETQHLRFQMLTGHLLDNSTHNTIEDIGCGICDLYGYLKDRDVKFTYSGTEIVSEMIAYAKRKYPDITIKNRDIMNESNAGKYDYVVLSGTLNMPGNIQKEEWKSFCYSLIRKMYGMCNKAMSFNFLTTHNTFNDPTLFYLDPAEAVDFCLRYLSRFVEMKHNYALYEATITVYRANYIQREYKDMAFTKYFSNNS